MNDKAQLNFLVSKLAFSFQNIKLVQDVLKIKVKNVSDIVGSPEGDFISL